MNSDRTGRGDGETGMDIEDFNVQFTWDTFADGGYDIRCYPGNEDGFAWTGLNPTNLGKEQSDSSLSTDSRHQQKRNISDISIKLIDDEAKLLPSNIYQTAFFNEDEDDFYSLVSSEYYSIPDEPTAVFKSDHQHVQLSFPKMDVKLNLDITVSELDPHQRTERKEMICSAGAGLSHIRDDRHENNANCEMWLNGQYVVSHADTRHTSSDIELSSHGPLFSDSDNYTWDNLRSSSESKLCTFDTESQAEYDGRRHDYLQDQPQEQDTVQKSYQIVQVNISESEESCHLVMSGGQCRHPVIAIDEVLRQSRLSQPNIPDLPSPPASPVSSENSLPEDQTCPRSDSTSSTGDEEHFDIQGTRPSWLTIYRSNTVFESALANCPDNPNEQLEMSSLIHANDGHSAACKEKGGDAFDESNTDASELSGLANHLSDTAIFSLDSNHFECDNIEHAELDDQDHSPRDIQPTTQRHCPLERVSEGMESNTSKGQTSDWSFPITHNNIQQEGQSGKYIDELVRTSLLHLPNLVDLQSRSASPVASEKCVADLKNSEISTSVELSDCKSSWLTIYRSCAEFEPFGLLSTEDCSDNLDDQEAFLRENDSHRQVREDGKGLVKGKDTSKEKLDDLSDSLDINGKPSDPNSSSGQSRISTGNEETLGHHSPSGFAIDLCLELPHDNKYPAFGDTEFENKSESKTVCGDAPADSTTCSVNSMTESYFNFSPEKYTTRNDVQSNSAIGQSSIGCDEENEPVECPHPNDKFHYTSPRSCSPCEFMSATSSSCDLPVKEHPSDTSPYLSTQGSSTNTSFGECDTKSIGEEKDTAESFVDLRHRNILQTLAKEMEDENDEDNSLALLSLALSDNNQGLLINEDKGDLFSGIQGSDPNHKPTFACNFGDFLKANASESDPYSVGSEETESVRPSESQNVCEVTPTEDLSNNDEIQSAAMPLSNYSTDNENDMQKKRSVEEIEEMLQEHKQRSFSSQSLSVSEGEIIINIADETTPDFLCKFQNYVEELDLGNYNHVPCRPTEGIAFDLAEDGTHFRMEDNREINEYNIRKFLGFGMTSSQSCQDDYPSAIRSMATLETAVNETAKRLASRILSSVTLSDEDESFDTPTTGAKLTRSFIVQTTSSSTGKLDTEINQNRAPKQENVLVMTPRPQAIQVLSCPYFDDISRLDVFSVDGDVDQENIPVSEFSVSDMLARSRAHVMENMNSDKTVELINYAFENDAGHVVYDRQREDSESCAHSVCFEMVKTLAPLDDVIRNATIDSQLSKHLKSPADMSDGVSTESNETAEGTATSGSSIDIERLPTEKYSYCVRTGTFVENSATAPDTRDTSEGPIMATIERESLEKFSSMIVNDAVRAAQRRVMWKSGDGQNVLDSQSHIQNPECKPTMQIDNKGTNENWKERNGAENVKTEDVSTKANRNKYTGFVSSENYTDPLAETPLSGYSTVVVASGLASIAFRQGMHELRRIACREWHDQWSPFAGEHSCRADKVEGSSKSAQQTDKYRRYKAKIREMRMQRQRGTTKSEQSTTRQTATTREKKSHNKQAMECIAEDKKAEKKITGEKRLTDDDLDEEVNLLALPREGFKSGELPKRDDSTTITLRELENILNIEHMLFKSKEDQHIKVLEALRKLDTSAPQQVDSFLDSKDLPKCNLCRDPICSDTNKSIKCKIIQEEKTAENLQKARLYISNMEKEYMSVKNKLIKRKCNKRLVNTESPSKEQLTMKTNAYTGGPETQELPESENLTRSLTSDSGSQISPTKSVSEECGHIRPDKHQGTAMTSHSVPTTQREGKSRRNWKDDSEMKDEEQREINEIIKTIMREEMNRIEKVPKTTGKSFVDRVAEDVHNIASVTLDRYIREVLIPSDNMDVGKVEAATYAALRSLEHEYDDEPSKRFIQTIIEVSRTGTPHMFLEQEYAKLKSNRLGVDTPDTASAETHSEEVEKEQPLCTAEDCSMCKTRNLRRIQKNSSGSSNHASIPHSESQYGMTTSSGDVQENTKYVDGSREGGDSEGTLKVECALCRHRHNN